MIFIKEILSFGIGTDMENISRFKKLRLDDNKLFFKRIFTKNELEYCFSYKKPAPHLAGRYVGKEAVIKALASINKLDIDYKNIEIVNNKDGVPLVKMQNIGDNIKIYLSLSHCADKAMAFAIAIEVKSNE